MPSLSEIDIPQEALPDLEKVIALESSVFDSLLQAICEVGPVLTPQQFAKQVSKKAAAVEYGTIRSLVGIMFFLYTLRDESDLNQSAKDIAKGIVNSAVVQGAGFSKENLELLFERVLRLATPDTSLAITLKALDVMREHERTFCGARILSDIRPIFSKTVGTADAAVIVHNLQIGFHHDGRHQEFYITLDADDIKTLKKVIERCEKKTATLQSILDKASIPYLES